MASNSLSNSWFSMAYKFITLPLLDHFKFSLMGSMNTRIWVFHNKYISISLGKWISSSFTHQIFGYHYSHFFLFCTWEFLEWVEWIREWMEREENKFLWLTWLLNQVNVGYYTPLWIYTWPTFLILHEKIPPSTLLQTFNDWVQGKERMVISPLRIMGSQDDTWK